MVLLEEKSEWSQNLKLLQLIIWGPWMPSPVLMASHPIVVETFTFSQQTDITPEARCQYGWKIPHPADEVINPYCGGSTVRAFYSHLSRAVRVKVTTYCPIFHSWVFCDELMTSERKVNNAVKTYRTTGYKLMFVKSSFWVGQCVMYVVAWVSEKWQWMQTEQRKKSVVNCQSGRKCAI